MSKEFQINILLFIVVLLLMIFNYTQSFMGSYDIGENVDDKTVILLSSQSFKFGITKKKEIFDRLLSKCELESSQAAYCSYRYALRANTINSYLLPGALISYGIDTKSMKFNELFSSAVFNGLTLTVILVFLYILFVMYRFKSHGSIFVLISFVFIALADPFIFDINFSIFSDVFTPSAGYGYLPNIYVTRGAVSYLLIPIVLSLVFNNSKLLWTSLLFAALIHLGYAVIYTFIALIVAIINLYIFKEEKKDVFVIIGILFFLTSIMASLSVYSSVSALTISFNHLNLYTVSNFLSDSRITLSFSTVAFYMALLMIFFFTISKSIKKYVIIIFVINIFLETILLFELLGIFQNSEDFLQRMQGSFSYLSISMLIIVIIHTVINFKRIYLNNKLSILILPALFLWVIEFNHSYMFKMLKKNIPLAYKNYTEPSPSILGKQYMKTSIVNTDVSSFINKYYANKGELYWLSIIDGIYYVDVDKIARLNFEDLDIDNEFLVLLYLYIKSRSNY